jgi:hypothetical protein
VQSPLAVKLTGRPELADALSEKAASPKVRSASAPNVMVWVFTGSQAFPTPLWSLSAWSGLGTLRQLSDASATPSPSVSGDHPVVHCSALTNNF